MTNWQRIVDEKRRQKVDMVKLSSNSRLVVDAMSGHHIQMDNPSVVIRSIRDAVESARSQKPLHP